MLELAADRTVCIGSGMCVLTCSEVFDQGDEDGLVTLLGTVGSAETERQTMTVPDKAAEAVRQAVHSCPSGALTLNE